MLPEDWHTLALWTIGVLIVCTLLLSVYVSYAILYPPFCNAQSGAELSKKTVSKAWGDTHTNPLHDFGIEYEDVEFDSVCGNTLRGWFIDRRQSRKSEGAAELRNRNKAASPKDDVAVVFVHGGGRDRRAFLRHTPLVCERGGFSALLYDARGHGASDLDHVGLSMGLREHEDVMEAVKYMTSTRGFKKVVLIGTSVGAYSSILATTKLPAELVAGVIAENPFTNIRDNVNGIVLNLACRRVVCRCGERFVQCAWPLRKLMEQAVWLLVGRALGKEAHMSSHDALQVIERIKQPILFMHGDNDHLIHHDHSHALYEAASEPKDVWIAPDADHCALINIHPDEYERRVLGFLQKCVA